MLNEIIDSNTINGSRRGAPSRLIFRVFVLVFFLVASSFLCWDNDVLKTDLILNGIRRQIHNELQIDISISYNASSQTDEQDFREIAELINMRDIDSNITLIVKISKELLVNGKIFTTYTTSNTPTIVIMQPPQNISFSSLFTMMMIDPDAPDPSAPSAAEWLHWLVVNVPPNQIINGFSVGNEVVSYAGPTPPIGKHRYVFLLYRQLKDEKIFVDDESWQQLNSRIQFPRYEFIDTYSLFGPVAAAYFYCSASSNLKN